MCYSLNLCLHKLLFYSQSAGVENLAIENMISKWTSEEVVHWLAEIGLGDLGHKFESNDIMGEQLIRLNEAELISQLNIGIVL